jgi:hypothetical protein
LGEERVLLIQTAQEWGFNICTVNGAIEYVKMKKGPEWIERGGRYWLVRTTVSAEFSSRVVRVGVGFWYKKRKRKKSPIQAEFFTPA